MNATDIKTVRTNDQDASAVAAKAASDAGTKLAGNLRWQGEHAPTCRVAPTADGRRVVVMEPEYAAE